MKKNQAETVDEYISGFPKEIQTILNEIRATVRKAAPSTTETIKYAIPTYMLNGNVFHFAAYKSHIGFYPAPKRSEELKEKIAPYLSSKSTLQFPLDKPVPKTLIAKVVKYLVTENKVKAKLKKLEKT